MDFKNRVLNIISTIMAIALIILIIFSNQKGSIYVTADEVSSGSGLVNFISKDTALAYIEEFANAQQVENGQTELTNEEEAESLHQMADSFNEDHANSERTNANVTSENPQSKEKAETEDKSKDEQGKIEKGTDSNTKNNNEEKKNEDTQDKEIEEKEAENNDPVITTKVVSETETIKYETVREDDASLPMGETKVEQEGENGTRTVTYLETYTDEELTNREQTKSEIKVEPVKKIIKVGIKEKLE